MTFSVRHRQNTARTALFLIGEEGKWSKDDAKLMKEETEAERVSLLMVGVGIQSFSVLNAIQGIVSERRRFYVLSSYDSLKWLSTELTRGPCLREYKYTLLLINYTVLLFARCPELCKILSVASCTLKKIVLEQQNCFSELLIYLEDIRVL